MIDWNEFDKLKNIDEYLPNHGDGDTMGTQAATAVSKIIWEWYNNGGAYDSRAAVSGWCNDVSGSANWLFNNIRETRLILKKIYDADEDGYTQILYDVASIVDPLIPELDKKPKIGSAYDDLGPFIFEEEENYEDEEDDYWDEEEEDEYSDDED